MLRPSCRTSILARYTTVPVSMGMYAIMEGVVILGYTDLSEPDDPVPPTTCRGAVEDGMSFAF
jgi:hypothetical protein